MNENNLIEQECQELQHDQFCQRFWEKDPDLWDPGDASRAAVADSLGWLDVAAKMEDAVDELQAFAKEVRDAGFKQVVHMGMGGSSLAPLVFQRSFRGSATRAATNGARFHRSAHGAGRGET